MFSRFFIDRPVFATVISLIIMLAGLISIRTLPKAQFPEITPPTVEVSANYPGASAEAVATSLASPIEQELSGAKNMLYFQSFCANDGSLKVVVTFEIGSDLDLAAVEVQNRVKRAEPRLPQETLRQGITVTKRSSSLLVVAGLVSDNETVEVTQPDGTVKAVSRPKYDQLYLSNYASVNMIDSLRRIPGAGDVQVFGAKDYAMRLWLDPDKLAQRGMTVPEVAAAVREQNGLYATGRIGQNPMPPGSEVELTVPVITRGRLDSPQEFENIILRANPDGSMLRLKDVGRTELGALSYDLFGRMRGQENALVLLYLQSGANALDVKEKFVQAMDEMQRSFPTGMRYEIPYDTTTFIEVSIGEVVRTLLEAVVLVLLVVFLFLQNWRATLIPLLAVPVAIVGTFAGMTLLGFSINTLTLFGMVLAIGIVVDDAIVVVENVERIMETEHLPPREATIKAMSEVTGPVIAIVLVLAAVFVPVAFLGGLTGQLYKQFAVTIAISVAISGLVALTLSPALCRLLLKPHGSKKSIIARVLDAILFKWFNKGFDGLTAAYTWTVHKTIKLAVVTLLIFGALLFTTYRLFQKVPSGFLPNEDQGYMISVVMLPDGASLDRTNAVAKEVEDFILSDANKDIVKNTVTLGGINLFSGSSSATNAAVVFTAFKPWAERTAPGTHATDMINRVWGKFGNKPEALVITFNPPSIQGLGTRAGFEFQLQQRGTSNVRELADVADKFMKTAAKQPEMTGLQGTLFVVQPQLFLELNRDRTKAMGVPVNEVFDTLQAYLGSLYVNDFNKFGRVYRVQLQAEPKYRMTPEDIGKIFVRNSAGEMLPISTIIETRWQAGPNIVSRFNGFNAVQITGVPGPGGSTGAAMEALRKLAKTELPPGYDIEWSGASYQEVKAGNQAGMVIGFGLLVVFLVLAAQYEKWTLPLAVLLAVPLGVLGALAAVAIRGLDRDIYFQIGLLTLVGLSAKNAILIVEFCITQRASGKGLVESAIEASRLRFRPILMTSLAFILGVVPLVISKGAGAAGRHSIGTGVMGGMIAATFLAIFFVPLFFVLITGLSERLRGNRQTTPSTPETPDHAAH
jgi:hydrophobe/amphiphile efflux-1 (HAE1) family protein